MGTPSQTHKLLLLTVFFCGARVSVSVAASTGAVLQPGAPVGSPLTLRCTFTTPTEALRIRVSWEHCPKPPYLYCRSRSSCLVAANRNSSSLASANESECRDGHVWQVAGPSWSNLTLGKPGVEDSGWYHCTVSMEIPSLRKFNSDGNGTQVDVIAPGVSPQNEECFCVPWWVWVIVAAGVLILAAVSAGVACACWRRRSQTTENPIYSNINPTPKNCCPDTLPKHPYSKRPTNPPKTKAHGLGGSR
ncbi:uncharacterized protein LOC133129837 [Conger conger]|uniref:uncharacterized protein LOC133129837 n=1 Tax=Conger conger TaxID=82655 RepID=UPI002A5A2869|nr:uncharacterized protein LOC133129837 [Conger conger]